MAIKDRLKDRRAQLDMTLEEVARRVGVTRATIQKYENGTISNIPPDKVEALAAALDTTPAFLMGWEEDTSAPYVGAPADLAQVKLALFGGDGEVTDEMWQEALFAAELIKNRHRRKKEKDD